MALESMVMRLKDPTIIFCCSDTRHVSVANLGTQGLVQGVVVAVTSYGIHGVSVTFFSETSPTNLLDIPAAI